MHLSNLTEASAVQEMRSSGTLDEDQLPKPFVFYEFLRVLFRHGGRFHTGVCHEARTALFIGISPDGISKAGTQCA
jgi:hypothetical protein